MVSNGRLPWAVLILSAMLAGHEAAYCQETISGAPNTVVARIGAQEILQGEVDFVLGRSLAPGQEELPSLNMVVQQNAIHMLGQQQQALQTLRELKQAASFGEVKRWLESTSGADRPNAKADDILQQIATTYGIDAERVLNHLAFRLSWKAYLAKHMTEANLKKHFASQKPRFDGTKFRVCYASVAVPAGESGAREKAVEALKALASQANSWAEDEMKAAGENWLQAKDAAEIAREFQLKWVRGTGDLDPALVSVLLRLKAGELSEPVHTATGVHLIKLFEVEAGDFDLEQVQDEVRVHMLVFLLEHLSQQSSERLPLQAAMN